MIIKTFTAAIFTACVALAANHASAQAPAPRPPGMGLTSSGFTDGGVIPDKYTQAAPAFVSPALAWNNVPAGTVTFVLLMRDPDVALNKKIDDVNHWTAFNIPGTAQALPENVPTTERLPDGTVQLKNITGKVGYLGPGAPANGPQHHYTFELYALDTKLTLGPEASRADVMAAMDGHILGKAVDAGRFRRPQ